MLSGPVTSNPADSNSHQLGKYRLVARLGQGGMGTVYLALASGLGQFRKLLVVKELRQDLTRDQEFVSMFTDEARLAARLDHPNVVQTFEAGQQADRYFLAMEYLDGQPLSVLIERLANRDGLPLPHAIQILSEVLSGLQYAHELVDYDGTSLQVVHRDVSPQNVFITYHGQVKVVDFGVAKAANASQMTEPGVFKGKFAYAAPEQILGRPVDARADIFAVGIMLWEAISGRRFSEHTPTPAGFRARASGDEPRIAEIVPEVVPLLAAICDRALSVDPERRFASAEEFRSELQEFMLLAGVRVESPEIGQLMRDVFEDERREMHLVIEQAMKHSGASDSSVEALPFMHHEHDKVATTVADLSSLVEISNETDDHKIRLSYAHSKVTSLPPRSVAPAQLSAAPAAIGGLSKHWLIASMALSTMCMVGLLVVVFGRGEPPPQPIAAVPLAATGPAAPAAPAAPAHIENPFDVTHRPQPSAASEDVAAPSEAPARGGRTMPAVRARRFAPAPGPRQRDREATPNLAPIPDPPAPQPSAAPAPKETEMGGELGPSRRAPAPRIDLEDPYQ
jgi:serine/threonine-protein kinase